MQTRFLSNSFHWIKVSLVIATLFAGFLACPAEGTKISVLVMGQPVEREIRGGQSHRYRVDPTNERQVWRIAVDQRGIDLVIRAFDSEGGEVSAVDAPFGRQGLERLMLEPSESGSYVIHVEPSSPAAIEGRYTLTVSTIPGDQDRSASLLAEKSMGEAGSFALKGGPSDLGKAIEAYTKAAEMFRKLDNPRDQALAIYAVASLSLKVGNLESAKENLHQTLLLWQDLGDVNFEAITLNDLGLAHLQLGEKKEAKALFEASAAKQKANGNAFGEAVPRSNLCLYALHLDDPRDSVPCFRRVLSLYTKAGEDQQVGVTLLNLGGAFDTLGEPKEAVAYYRRAVSEFRSLGYGLGEAQALHNLGMTLKRLGQVQNAMEQFQGALLVFKNEGDLRWQAAASSNLGDALALLGDLPRALSFYEQSLELRRQVKDKRGEGITLGRIAEAKRRFGDLDEALVLHRQSVDLLRQAGDSWREAMARGQLGQVQAQMGRHKQARASLDLALRRHKELGDTKNEAQTSLFRGRAALKAGDFWAAEADFQQALKLHESLGWLSAVAESHFELAQTAEQRGRLEESLRSLRAGLDAVESLRDRVEVPSLQASFIAGVSAAYRLEVDLLMRLGRPEQAFAASERARARTLLALLAESKADRLMEPREELQARRQKALDRLNAKAQRRLLLAGRSSPKRLEEAVQELDAALVEMELVHAELRRAGLETKAFSPINAAQARQLMDEDTLMLEYALGEKRSYLFAVGSSGLDTFELPGRQALEPLIRSVVESMSTLVAGAAKPGVGDEQRLSRILLGPVADKLGEKKIVIVADGGLHHLPFEALPLPGGSQGEPLIIRHEVMYVPSASVLAMEDPSAGKKLAETSRSVAIFADPVYGQRDARLLGSRSEGIATLSASLVEDQEGAWRSPALGAGLQRLPGTRREAALIAELFPADRVTMDLKRLGRPFSLPSWAKSTCCILLPTVL